MRTIHGRWRLTGTLVLLIAILPVFTMVSSPRVDRVLAQLSDALRVSYPVDGSQITGDTVPVVWGAGDGSKVALILDDSFDVESGDTIQEGDGVVIVSESPALLPGVEPGDHTVSVVVVDIDGTPIDPSDAVTVDVTVTASQTAGIYPGLCGAIGADAAYDLNDVAFGIGGLEPGQVYPDSVAIQTRSAGVPFTVVGAISDTTLDVSLSDLLAEAQVISLAGTGIAGLDDGESAACGEVGGVVASGILNIGLRQQPNSPLFGIASLIDLGDTTRVVIESALTDSAAPEDTEPLDEGEAPVELPVSLQQGVCDSLNADVSTELDTTAELKGETSGEGVSFATRVLVSETTIDQRITDLLARATAITVAASGLDGIKDGNQVACGEVGGPVLSGVARVALTERDGSGVQGMATLFAQGESTTIVVELFRVGGSNAVAKPSKSPSARASPSASASPSPSAAASPKRNNDIDNDGVRDSVDNCLNEPNKDQADEDGDGLGDVCDTPVIPAADSDGDGVPDTIDNCTFVPNPGQTDSDGNGIGNICDEVTEPTVAPEPTATDVPVVPTATDVPVVPTATDVPVVPTATDVPVVPTATDVPVVPTATDVPVVPTATDVLVTPTATDVPVMPTATTAGLTASAVVTEIPLDLPPLITATAE